jgi:hypothetical protein
LYKTGKVIAQLFAGWARVSLWYVEWTRMKKASGFQKAFAFTMVEPQKIFANPTIAANGREIKVSNNWFCIVTLFNSKKS